MAAGVVVESSTPEKIGQANKEDKKESTAGDSGIQVAGNTTVYKTVGEKESVAEKSVSRAMDPNILDDVDGKPKVLNQTGNPPDAFCGCCIVM